MLCGWSHDGVSGGEGGEAVGESERGRQRQGTEAMALTDSGPESRMGP